MSSFNEIKTIYLFSELDDEALSLVADHSSIKNLNKGEIIFFDSEPYLGFYGVLEGSVKIYKISKDGKEHILHFINTGNTFAEVPLFENLGDVDEDMAYPANAMAIEDDTRVLLFHKECIISLLEKDRRLCFKMLNSISKRLRFLNKHIEEVTLKDVTKRLAGYILLEYNKNQLNSENKPLVHLDISKYDLSCYLGTITETVSRTFRKLQDDDILIVNGRNILIKDIDRLKEIAK